MTSTGLDQIQQWRHQEGGGADRPAYTIQRGDTLMKVFEKFLLLNLQGILEKDDHLKGLDGGSGDDD